MITLLYIILGVICFFLWSAIHEFSHLVMADFLVGTKSWEIKLYPHMHNGVWYWARTEWEYKEQPTSKQMAKIALAPRLMDMFAVVLLPMWSIIPPVGIAGTWIVLTAAGLVDLANGSLGITSSSDLQIASTNLGISPWWLRLGGFLLVFVSVTLAFIAA